jgi:hypothetical protein
MADQYDVERDRALEIEMKDVLSALIVAVVMTVPAIIVVALS